jgi:hypothetical protein
VLILKFDNQPYTFWSLTHSTRHIIAVLPLTTPFKTLSLGKMSDVILQIVLSFRRTTMQSTSSLDNVYCTLFGAVLYDTDNSRHTIVVFAALISSRYQELTKHFSLPNYFFSVTFRNCILALKGQCTSTLENSGLA